MPLAYVIPAGGRSGASLRAARSGHELLATGPAAINQAVKAIAIARTYLRQSDASGSSTHRAPLAASRFISAPFLPRSRVHTTVLPSYDEAAAVSQQDSLYEYRRYLFWLRLRRGGIAGNDYEAENGDPPPRRSRSPPLSSSYRRALSKPPEELFAFDL